MITDAQKNEIDKKYFPNGLFWISDNRMVMHNFNRNNVKPLDSDFENIENYDLAVKKAWIGNARFFFYEIRELTGDLFIKKINSQYLNYTIENKENAVLWLKLTYDVVLKGVGFKVEGITDVDTRANFIEWYNVKIKDAEDYATQQINNTGQTPPEVDVNVFCKSMSLSIPKEHFIKLVEEKSKNGKPFLTQDQFNIFIERAFLGKEDVEKQKINMEARGEKLKVQYLFRQFYDNYSFEYLKTTQTQDVFIKLLTDNFIGWDFDNVKANFKPKTIPKNPL